jgi:F420-dependent methylenetetrahydromethanopterin dehydrogenase
MGEDATFIHIGNPPASVKVIYVSPYAEIPAAFGAGVAGSKPMAAVMTDDAPLLAVADTLTVRGTDYTIVSPEPDVPGGFTKMQLQLV